MKLFLDPTAAEPIRVGTVVACLVLGQDMRGSECKASVWGGKFEENRAVLGHYVHT